MRNFLSIMFTWAVVIGAFGLFFAGVLIQSFLASVLFLAFTFSVPTALFMEQNEKIKQLETRISKLEDFKKEQSK